MKQIIQTVLISAIVAFAVLFLMGDKPSEENKPQKKIAKSGYEQVAKTGVLKCAYATWPPHMMKELNTGKLSGASYDQMEEMAKFLEIKVANLGPAGVFNESYSVPKGDFQLKNMFDTALIIPRT